MYRDANQLTPVVAGKYRVPVIALLHPEPSAYLRQDDPEVINDVKRCGIVDNPKFQWNALMERMIRSDRKGYARLRQTMELLRR